MFLELVATFIAGLAGAGLMMLINRLTGRRLPKWLTPVAAGAAMIAATISSEYGWYDRTRDTLPEGFSVVQTVESKAFYRPWTYAWPYTERFVALDTASVRTNQNLPDMRMADLFFYGRWSPLNRMTVMVDCVENRRAPLVDAIEFNDNGEVIGADWIPVAETDPLLTSICEA
ncbi:hypothetical protein [Shimia aestuarii]|uniref:Uncharacterized protein n=1 Tax=Shimia aestuarii TaxID=254406 RepID=A0A1I4LAG8_9RHOB|nr:hypothetical protein [Shimia aestuarii]SFL88004.1 hypothetical protein SAMN04488042_1026 [Shimia aestuarii]